MSASAPIRVAIIDDDIEINLSLSEVLRHASDIELTAAFTSGEEAIAQLVQFMPDVILVDLRLGGMSGIECVLRLKELYPALRVLMFSGYESDDKVLQSLRAGAGGYLCKPLRPGAILDAIRDIYVGGAPMSSGAARRLVTHFQEQSSPIATMNCPLSGRERQVMDMLVQGLRYKEIADSLDLSISTIRTHIGHIYEKLDVTSRTEAVVKYLKAD